MSHRIYLAARYPRHPEMREVRTELQRLGYTVTSRWIDRHNGAVPDNYADFLNTNPGVCVPFAVWDIEDVTLADIVISFTDGGSGRGGRHVEFGYALALQKRLIVRGPREHVFHTLYEVEQVADRDALLGLLRSETSS